MRTTLSLRVFGAGLLLAPFSLSIALEAQQVVQRGPFGRPAALLDETEQWTAPLMLASDRDTLIFIPDVSSTEWLQSNYPNFRDRGTYTLTLFTFYKTPEACRENQVRWGLGDAAHLNACIDVGYRVRRAKIDPQQKSITLITAAMTDKNGAVIPSSIMGDGRFRTWDQLDTNTQLALKKADALITVQMKKYDLQQQSIR